MDIDVAEYENTISDLRSELSWAQDEYERIAIRLEAAQADAERWMKCAVDLTGGLSHEMIENSDLKKELELVKARLAFYEDGVEQLRKLFISSGDADVKPVNAHEFAKTVYRRVVKTIGEAPTALPNQRLFPASLPL